LSLTVAVHASDQAEPAREGGLTPHSSDVDGRVYCLFSHPATGGDNASLGCS